MGGRDGTQAPSLFPFLPLQKIRLQRLGAFTLSEMSPDTNQQKNPMNTDMKTTNAVSHLRAFIAYAETMEFPRPFTLIPYAEAIAAGIPFAETLVHEGNDWAVFIAGDCSPEDHLALEQAGIIDDADDARQDLTKG